MWRTPRTANPAVITLAPCAARALIVACNGSYFGGLFESILPRLLGSLHSWVARNTAADTRCGNRVSPREGQRRPA